MLPKKIIVILMLSFFIKSCTKEVDFNQIDEASIQPTYISTLVYLDLESKSFLNEFNEEIEFTTNLMENPLKSSSKSDLEKVEFTVKTANTFNRNFIFRIIFFDEVGNIIYELEEVNILPNTEENTIILEIPKDKIDILFIAKYIGFSVVMESSDDGSIILPSDIFMLNLKSSVTLYFNFKNQ